MNFYQKIKKFNPEQIEQKTKRKEIKNEIVEIKKKIYKAAKSGYTRKTFWDKNFHSETIETFINQGFSVEVIPINRTHIKKYIFKWED